MNKNNIKLLWSILCQESSVDANTNNISLSKIIEELSFTLKMEELDKLKGNPKFDPLKPIVLPFTSQLVLLWQNIATEPKLEYSIKVLVKDPKNKIIQEVTSNIIFKDGKERLRVIISINGFPLTSPGEYTYNILAQQTINGEFLEVGCLPVKVDIDLQRGE